MIRFVIVSHKISNKCKDAPTFTLSNNDLLSIFGRTYGVLMSVCRPGGRFEYIVVHQFMTS